VNIQHKNIKILQTVFNTTTKYFLFIVYAVLKSIDCMYNPFYLLLLY